MESGEDVKDLRVLISHLPSPSGSESREAGNKDGFLLRLRHPKSGSPTSYLFNGGSLQELHWFKQPYSSWFLGNYVCEDGSLYAATPVDLVFILLPIFQEARMKKGNNLGKFRQLDEILFVNGYPGYQHLVSHAVDSMQVVCEVKEIGSSKFFRLDDSKVLAWLCHKVDRVKLSLQTLDKNYAVQDERDTFRDITSLLGEYLEDEPWLKLLCSHLGFEMQDLAKKTAPNEASPMAEAKPSGSFEPVHNSSGKGASAPRRQSKRLKQEVASQNIKDMFRNASKSKT